MKRIIIVSHSAGNGGAERVSVTLANQFAEHGYDVIFYAIHSDKRDYELDARVHYVFNNVKSKNKALKQLERAWKLKKYIDSHEIDTMISVVCLEGIFLLGNHKLNKIYSLRNDPTKVLGTGYSKRLRDVIYRNANHIVFQTPDARDYFEEGIREKGVIIPNPLKDGLPVWNADGHGNDIIAACRITEQKNLKMLLDAFKIFCEKNQKNRLVIYGQGDLKEYYEAYARQLNLGERVKFAGFCNTIQEKMVDAAMYVSSSDYEGISNSMLEALAIGTPSICTDCPVGGARMFIESGVGGYLTPTGDAGAMADKMLKLADDEQLQKMFSEHSQKIREELTAEKIYRMWEELV